MTKDEALCLALEALENLAHYADTCELFLKETHPSKADALRNRVTNSIEAITAIKAALEAKDEPVATKNNDGVTLHLGWDDLPVGTKLYATPPQRTWVGLTNEDIALIDWESLVTRKDCVQVIEARLKEKNT